MTASTVTAASVSAYLRRAGFRPVNRGREGVHVVTNFVGVYVGVIAAGRRGPAGRRRRSGTDPYLDGERIEEYPLPHPASTERRDASVGIYTDPAAAA